MTITVFPNPVIQQIYSQRIQPPIAELLGFTLESASPGEAVIVFQAERRHANPMGTLHGGMFGVIADSAMGLAYATTLAPDESFTTLELKVNFLKPVWTGRLIATGRVTKKGSTVGLTTCEVTDEHGSLVAFATSTCMTLRGDQAAGR